MKYIAKPSIKLSENPGEVEDTLLISQVSVQRLIDDCLLALSREVRNIAILSVKGKLPPETARDLRDHTKLLFELKDREKDALKGITDEQLEALYNTQKENK